MSQNKAFGTENKKRLVGFVRRTQWILSTVAIFCLLLLMLGRQSSVASAAGICSVTYSTTSVWANGATIKVVITNNSATAINGWTLAFAFPGNQTITSAWDATYTQTGMNVSAKNLSYNASIGANGGTVSFGFNNDFSGSNTFPTVFTLNGVACGDTVPTNTATNSAVPSVTSTPSRTPIPSANLALNKPVACSSVETGNDCAKAVDGNLTTRWSSLYADPQWIQVDLGAYFMINRVVLRWETAYGKNYQIQTSTDTVTWSTIYTTTVGDGAIDDLSIAGSGRYIRVAGTVRGTAYGYSLYEFEIYGVGGPTPTPTNTFTPTNTATITSTPTITPTQQPNVNLALNKLVTCSSVEAGANVCTNAVDGNLTTRWSSLYADPQSFLVDLGSVQTIKRIILRWEAAYARSYQLQTSSDNASWTTLYSTTTGDGSVDDLNISGSGRYIRMSGAVRGTTFGYSLYEFEVYSVPGPTPTPTTVPVCSQSPADLQANAQAVNLLCYLKTHKFVSGQTDLADMDKVKQLTGRYPAILAFDFMEYTNGRIDTQATINWAKANKGIVAFQWHWYCPRGGNYAANCDFQPDLTNPSSKLYQDIDLVMRELKKMGDAGVPVLFRPLHEANNNYMWWAKKGSGAYKQLWHLIYQRAQLAGVHNVLWVFNGMASGQGTGMAEWYPGDSEVDVVSSDYFQSQSDYNTLKAIGNGNKILAIAETMNQLNPANAAPWNYSVVWASRDWNSNSANDWKIAMSNPLTISIDQLPVINLP